MEVTVHVLSLLTWNKFWETSIILERMIEQSISYEFWTVRVWSSFQFSFFFFFFFYCFMFILLHWWCIDISIYLQPSCSTRLTRTYFHTCLRTSPLSNHFHLYDGVCTIPRIPYVALSFHHESLKLKKVEQIWKKTFFLKFLRNLPINAHFYPSYRN